MSNVFSHPYQLDESISNLMVGEWNFSFLFKFQKKLLKRSGEPDQTPHLIMGAEEGEFEQTPSGQGSHKL